MALIVNSTNIPAGGKVIQNGTAAKQIYFGSTKVWSATPPQLVLYDGPGNINRMTAVNFGNVYNNNATTQGNGVKCWNLSPWGNGDSNLRTAAILRSSAAYDLTDYTTYHMIWTSYGGYGAAPWGVPRCTMYTATVTGALPHTNSPARTWAVTDTNEYKIDSGWHTGTYSIASVQGMNYVYVGNWGNGNASSVYVQKLWLT